MNRSWLNTLVISITAALVAGGLVFFVMQRRLGRLEAVQRLLQAELANASKLREDARLQAVEADRDQREKDKTELLRLRGEVGRLRPQRDEMEKLRKENQALTSALTKIGKANENSPDPEADPERQIAIAHLTDAKQLVLGLMMFAQDNQDSVPAALNQTSNYWGEASRLLTNQFELVLQRPFREVTNPSAVIAVRQKEAWQSKGNWVKAYGFADGHAELKKEPPEGFEAWEQQHIQPLSPR